MDIHIKAVLIKDFLKEHPEFHTGGRELLERLETRWDKAMEILDWGDQRTPILTGYPYPVPHVKSQTQDGVYYGVTKTRCECIDSAMCAPMGWCKHRLALWIHQKRKELSYDKPNQQHDVG